MISYALDQNNDLIISNGNFKTVSEGAEVVQHVRSRLLFYRGEWFLDLTVGVPYFQTIFTKPVNLATIESELKLIIVQTDGINKLLTFSMDFDSNTRKLDVSFSAETDYGIIDTTQVTING